ncbi:MAG: class II aldolase/adducin family protein [Propionibacteriales bacterium]|nr:class II aldolase/adducin family protein [Propionibacteriales bacterium]
MTSAEDLRREVALGCRVLDREGQGDFIWGHVSARDPQGRGAWLKGAGLGFDEITSDDVILVDRDGGLLEGEGRVHFEYPIHTEVLAARPDVGAVVHTHAEAAVAFAATGMPLRPIGHEGTLFTPPDIARYTKTSDLIMNAELGASVAQALDARNAVLLVNHGIVTVGADVATAVMTAVILERACRSQLLASASGLPLTWTHDDEALRKREGVYGEHQIGAAWVYLRRRLDPDS